MRDIVTSSWSRPWSWLLLLTHPSIFRRFVFVAAKRSKYSHALQTDGEPSSLLK